MQISNPSVVSNSSVESEKTASAMMQVSTAGSQKFAQAVSQLIGVRAGNGELRMPSVVDEIPLGPIDRWLEQNGLNEFGDPPGVAYLGGTPLYDVSTGMQISRLAYILSKHPELRSLLPESAKSLVMLPPELQPHYRLPAMPGFQQVQQILQYMVLLIESLVGALFKQPAAPVIPQPSPGGIDGPSGYPLSPVTVIEREISKVKDDLNKLEARIRKYEMSGKPAPKGWRRDQSLLRYRLAQLQARLNKMISVDLGQPPRGYRREAVYDEHDRLSLAPLTPTQKVANSAVQDSVMKI
jgi:hypothetical protein